MSESGLTSRLASLKPFSRSKHHADDEDAGDKTDSTTVAGGGHASRRSEITSHQLRVSQALKSFLVHHKVLSKHDAGLDSPDSTDAVRALVDKPHIKVPPYVTDRSHPLPEYFISSSHNTYLMAHQLFGTSSAKAYERALDTGSRCVEIDAWDNDKDPNEPKVTHGYTLVSHISFRSACEAIRDVVDKEATQPRSESGYPPGPVFLSLENHCGPDGQKRLVDIMTAVWGDRLLSKRIRDKGHQEEQGSGEHVTLEELDSKIVVIVEYHFPGEPDSDREDSSSSEEDEEEEDREARKIYEENKKSAPATAILPELAELGVYAQSVKPRDNSWFSDAGLHEPHHHLINISESGLKTHMPTGTAKIARHNAHHLMRVYPKGTRISSNNLNPVPFWGLGAQICALNWQTFAAPLQINEALFSGSDGYVLKPAALRAGGDGNLNTGKKVKLHLHAAGASDVPLPTGRNAEDIKPYLTCTLMHPDDADRDPPKHKTSPYKQHKLAFLHSGDNPPANDPVWDEVLKWEYDDNELVFLRLLIKSDDSFARNPILAVASVRLLYVQQGWNFIRMLDLKGRETTCSLLVRFEIEEV